MNADRLLAEAMEGAIDATRIADHDTRIGRLVAGRVEKPATLDIRSAKASRNELATDVAAAGLPIEDAMMAMGPIPAPPTSTDMAAMIAKATRGALAPAPVPFRGGRPLSRRDPGEHGAASLPLAEDDRRIKVVTLTVDVPIIVSDIEAPAKTVEMAMSRVRQQMPDAMLFWAPCFVDCSPADAPAYVWDDERRIADRILNAIDAVNEDCDARTEERNRRDSNEYLDTVDDAYRAAKGGGA